MKNTILIICNALFIFNIGNAQEINKPTIYNFDVYIDNIRIGSPEGLNSNLMSAIIYEHYYKGFFENDPRWMKKKLRDSYIEKYDSLGLGEKRLYYITKEAKDGYLRINMQLNKYLAQLDHVPLIDYFIDGDKVVSKKQVKQLMNLSDNKIQDINLILSDKKRLEVRIILANT